MKILVFKSKNLKSKRAERNGKVASFHHLQSEHSKVVGGEFFSKNLYPSFKGSGKVFVAFSSFMLERVF